MAGLEGRTLDRYEVRQLIGRGGMADVYLGYDTRFQRQVAVKVFKREDEEMLKRFIREAQLMASWRNPHLMPVYDAGEIVLSGVTRYYIVMPFMEGGTLRARIKQAPISLEQACRYLQEIASALDYMHKRGIIHRDIKPSNVLLDDEGRCYVADFGIARTTSEATQLTSTGDVLGTVDYVAPELFEPDRRADARSDLYSLGVLLFEMVTGQTPFRSENQLAMVAMHISQPPPSPRKIVPDLSPQVEHVILRALEKKPEQRYGSATELAETFCRAVSLPAAKGAGTWKQQERKTGLQEPLVLPPVSPGPTVPPSLLANTIQASPPAYSRQQGVRRKQPASPARTRGVIVTLLALLALLAVVGPALYVVLTGAHLNAGTHPPQTGGTNAATSPSPTATPNLTATAQAVAALATQQAKNATATAIAQATVTAQVQATATAAVIVTATAGKTIYTDALNNADNADTVAAQWDQNNNCTFHQDGYHVTAGAGILGQGALHGCLEASNMYANTTISVDVAIQSGHSGGLFFDVKTRTFGTYAGYLFEIDSNGNYKISRSANFSTGSGSATLQDWTASSAIKTGKAKNTLQVILRNGSELFYVNGVFLVAEQDTTYSSGNLALLATSNNGDSAEVIYSNLNVYPASP